MFVVGSTHQENIGDDGVLEAGVGEGVYGRDGAGRHPVQLLQHHRPHILQLHQVQHKQPWNKCFISHQSLWLELKFHPVAFYYLL